MPRVKIDYVVSFSSEDPDNQASNLLNLDVSKKRWLCPKGEPSCSVVLQLTKAVQISAVHVGAHHAALVEVLVGRSETPHNAFEVLVPSCVFLNPSESRREENVERVRSFSEAQLTAARAQRWDRLRLVCSQPYNKHCKYGLNFVQVYEPEPARPAAGRLARAASASSDDEFRPGELFAKLRQAPSSDTDTGAQIRQASSQALKQITDSATKLVKTPITKAVTKKHDRRDGDFGSNRQKDSLMYTEDDDKPHAKIDQVVQRHKDDMNKDEPASKKLKLDNRQTKNDEPTSKKHKLDGGQTKTDESVSKKSRHDETMKKNFSNDNVRKNVKKDESGRHRDRSDKCEDRSRDKVDTREEGKASTSQNRDSRKGKPSRERKTTELGSVLRGVELVLSGYVHPRRAALRRLAAALGARCLHQWGPSATHLICAFPNTPKLVQVRNSANGARAGVVKGEWLEDCFRRRKRLRLGKYLTEGPVDDGTDSSDGEESSDDETTRAPDVDECDTDDEIERAMKRNETIADAGGHAHTDTGGHAHIDTGGHAHTDTGGHTHAGSHDAGDATTRDEDDTDEDTVEPLKEEVDAARALPGLFSGLVFLVADHPPPRHPPRLPPRHPPSQLTRYLAAYGALVLQESEVDENSTVDYVVCSERAEPSGRVDGSSPMAGAAKVSPAWVFACHEAKKLLPTGNFS